MKSCVECPRRWLGISKRLQEKGANFTRWHCLEHRKIIGENGTDEDLIKAKGCNEWESVKAGDWVKI